MKHHATTGIARIVTFLLVVALARAICGCALQAPEPASSPAEDSREGNAAETVAFSATSGVYPSDNLTLTLTAPKGATVAYTTDGSTPTAAHDTGKATLTLSLAPLEAHTLASQASAMLFPDLAQQFNDAPDLPSGVIVRAAACGASGSIGAPTTHVYFLGIDFSERFPECLVASVAVDPVDLLDHERGILATGAVYETWKDTPEAHEIIQAGSWWQYQANFTQHGREWERPCFLQLYDADTQPVRELWGGIRVTGGTSRIVSQKSFNLYFRDTYGPSHLSYELFDGIATYESFRLRAGGNNAEWLKFKDALLMDLVKDRSVITARSRTAVLFLNGEYWGPYLLSEKISAQMLADHTGVDPHEVIVVKEQELEEGIEGDLLLYDHLMSFAQKDLSDPTIWAEFCTVMNVESFADYCAIRVYVGDNDWLPDKNDVLWRTRDHSYDDGRWHYVLYDVEYSSGLYGIEETSPEWDHFTQQLERYPLFKAAMQNPAFRTLFLQSLKEIGSNCYAPSHVESALKDYLDLWNPLLDDCYRRYGDHQDLWTASLDATRGFFERRYSLLVPKVEDWIAEQEKHS